MVPSSFTQFIGLPKHVNNASLPAHRSRAGDFLGIQSDRAAMEWFQSHNCCKGIVTNTSYSNTTSTIENTCDEVWLAGADLLPLPCPIVIVEPGDTDITTD